MFGHMFTSIKFEKKTPTIIELIMVLTCRWVNVDLFCDLCSFSWWLVNSETADRQETVYLFGMQDKSVIIFL